MWVWHALVPLIEITAILCGFPCDARQRRPPATPASDARQRRPPAAPASDARRRHGPARKQWAMPRVGLLSPANNHGTSRPYLPDSETPPCCRRRAAFWWSGRFLVHLLRSRPAALCPPTTHRADAPAASVRSEICRLAQKSNRKAGIPRSARFLYFTASQTGGGGA